MSDFQRGARVRISYEGTVTDLLPLQVDGKTVHRLANVELVRIPEPGPWGVVEANVEGWTDGPSRFVNFGGSWIAKSPFGTKHASWSDLIDPTLVREGVDDA